MAPKPSLIDDTAAGRIALDLDRNDCQESLYHFFQGAWPYIDSAKFQDGWVLDAIAEHLEAVVGGEIRNLLINVPPRTSKSSLVNVVFPAWVWAQPTDSATSGPGVQLLTASYSQNLILRDAVKSRRLIESPWFQQRWGDRFHLKRDQNAKGRFDNSRGGSRFSTSVGATLTGEGGNIIIVDDPNNAKDSNSQAVLESTIEWFDGSLSTRFNDPKKGALIVVQQRLNERDITGHILSTNQGDWTHLMLPMRYEPARAYHIYPNNIGFEDPREEEGELLWEERFDETVLKKLEARLGPYGTAGQLQQRPMPKGGGIIKRACWRTYEAKTTPEALFVLASLDTAYTEKKENDPSAMTIWTVYNDGSLSSRVLLSHAWAEHLEFHDLVTKVAKDCRKFQVNTILIENKAAGHSVAQELRRLYGYEDWSVQLVDPKQQDKIARAYVVQHLFESGMVFAPDTAWAEQVITECETFPKGLHDDLVDTVTQALRYLRNTNMLATPDEASNDLVSSQVFHGNSGAAPLYPGA